MPKIKLDFEQQITKEFLAKLMQKAILKDLANKKEIAEDINIPYSTFKTKLVNPNSFTFREIIKIIDKLKFSEDDILEVFGKKRSKINLQKPLKEYEKNYY